MKALEDERALVSSSDEPATHVKTIGLTNAVNINAILQKCQEPAYRVSVVCHCVWLGVWRVTRQLERLCCADEPGAGSVRSLVARKARLGPGSAGGSVARRRQRRRGGPTTGPHGGVDAERALAGSRLWQRGHRH
jgi:hypothetical protein